jgi:hypothetical protein
MSAIFLVAERLETSQGGLISIEVISYEYIYIYICFTCSDPYRKSLLLSCTYEDTIHNFTFACYKYNNYLVIYNAYMSFSVQAV